MKKFIVTMVAMFAMVFASFAQQPTVEGSRVFDNTYIGVSVGGQVGMTDMIGHQNWTVAPYGSVYFGKWFTPVVGAEINADVLFHDGFSSRNKVVDATYLGAATRFNLNNLFHGYRGRPDRVEVIPFVGLGWVHTYGTGVMGEHGNMPSHQFLGKNVFATKMGIDVAFNLGEKRSWVIDVRPTVMYALTGGAAEGIQFNVYNGRVGLEVGFTHKFGYKNSTGKRTNNFTRAYTVAEYDAMVEELTAMAKQAEPTVVTNEVEVVKEVVKEVAVEKPVYLLNDAYFTQGKAVLDPTSDVMLNVLATEMIESGKEYVITGYASVEGEETFNKQLSYNRAEAVKNGLVERGVNADKLTVVGAGATDEFGYSYELNRKVVVTEKE